MPDFNLAALEKETIVKALEYYEGNRVITSEALGVSVRTLRNKLHTYKMAGYLKNLSRRRPKA